MTTRVTHDMTTTIGTISFPHLFVQTKTTNDKGEDVYDVQFIIPKSDRDGLRAIMAGIKKVGEAQWGDRWRSVRQPLRDGDKEAKDLTDDGQTKGEKYPERNGCFFINARSKRPVGVVDRQRVPITDPDQVYGGCKGKINITLYPYSQSGNQGIGVSLNGVQKIADGESFGGSRPSVESMFDILDEDDDLGLDEFEEEVEEEPAPKPAKKAAAKKATTKKAAARKPEPEEVEVEEDEDDLFEDFDDSDL